MVTLIKGKACLPPSLKLAFDRKPYSIYSDVRQYLRKQSRGKIEDIGYSGYDVYNIYYHGRKHPEFLRGKDYLELVKSYTPSCRRRS